MSSVVEGLESTGIIYFLLFVCILAVLANLMVLLVITQNKSFRGVTEMFMGNMAVSDILLAGIAIPIRLTQGLQIARSDNNFLGGIVGCKLSMFIPNFTIASSILTMVAISLDRYFSICHHRKLGMRGVVVTLTFIWLLSLCASAPQFYEYSLGIKREGESSGEEEEVAKISSAPVTTTERMEVTAAGSKEENETEPHTYISCGSHDIAENFEVVYSAVFIIGIYLSPLILICINYLNIGRFLWKVAKATEASGTTGAVSKGKVKVAKMLFIVTAVFAILWAPYFVLFAMEELTGTDDSANSNSLLHTIKQTAVVLSTISNPVLYYIFNDRFKKAAIVVATCGHVHSGQISNMEASVTQIGPQNQPSPEKTP